VDKDAGKIERLGQGIMPIYEPGLDVLVAQNVAAGRLAFTTEAARRSGARTPCSSRSGTPSRARDGHADLSYVYAGPPPRSPGSSTDSRTIVVKSTVPVAERGDEVAPHHRRAPADADVAVVSHPEFPCARARPSRTSSGRTAWWSGSRTERARTRDERTSTAPLFLNETPILFMDRRTSELTKYARERLSGHEDHLHQTRWRTFASGSAPTCSTSPRGIGLD
jgi:UDPglucose 6-dehydrogenase